jgi:hypothetical protein
MFDLSKYCRFLEHNYRQYIRGHTTDFDCPFNELYHYRILIAALSLCGYTAYNVPMIPLYDLSIFLQLEQYTLYEIGYIINYGGGHWVALQRAISKPYKYRYIDSVRSFSKPYNSIGEYISDNLGRQIHNVLLIMRRCIQINDPGDYYETTKKIFIEQDEKDARTDELHKELEKHLTRLGLASYILNIKQKIEEDKNYIDINTYLRDCTEEKIYGVLKQDGTTVITSIRALLESFKLRCS